MNQGVGPTYTLLDLVVGPFFAFLQKDGLLLFISLDDLDELVATQLHMDCGQ